MSLCAGLIALLFCHIAIAISNSSYMTNEQLFEFMRQTNREYPTMTHVYSIGQSAGGQELLVIALSATQPDEHLLLRPETKYIGNIHGNEALSREVLARFIRHMLESYGTDPVVTQLMITSRIHVMPTMNPDGYGRASVGECGGVDGRYNNDGVDLNRDFPDVFDSKYRSKANMQPESLAVLEWIESEQFVLTANLHGGSMVVNYPYDSSPNADSWDAYGQPNICEDDDAYREISKVYSFAHRTMRQSECSKFEDGITNGAEWYIAQGTMQDYNYVKAGCMAVTIEIACCKYPLFNTVEESWLDNKIALTSFLQQANIGVKGIVLAKDGKVASGLHIQVDKRMVVDTTPLGEYWKLLLPGSYTLNVSWHDKVLTSIQITAPDSGVAVYNITLPYTSDDIEKIMDVQGPKDGSSILLPSTYILVTLYTTIQLF